MKNITPISSESFNSSTDLVAGDLSTGMFQLACLLAATTGRTFIIEEFLPDDVIIQDGIKTPEQISDWAMAFESPDNFEEIEEVVREIQEIDIWDVLPDIS